MVVVSLSFRKVFSSRANRSGTLAPPECGSALEKGTLVALHEAPGEKLAYVEIRGIVESKRKSIKSCSF